MHAPRAGDWKLDERWDSCKYLNALLYLVRRQINQEGIYLQKVEDNVSIAYRNRIDGKRVQLWAA